MSAICIWKQMDMWEICINKFYKKWLSAHSWNALKAASQDPNPAEITSNTQWSINYNNTNLTAEVVLRRNWDDVVTYDLNTNKLEV